MGRRPRLTLTKVVALTLLLTVGLGAGVAGAKKKKKKGGGRVDVTQAANLPIPDAALPEDNPAGVARSTITVGREFKGKRIRDVNVTLQLTGSDANATGDITAVVSAPNGASAGLMGGNSGTTQFGPLTLDDESPNILGFGTGAQAAPGVLFAPFVGSAMPFFHSLSTMDDGPVRGTWTLTLVDDTAGDTTVLNLWRLQVVAGNPFKTKP